MFDLDGLIAKLEHAANKPTDLSYADYGSLCREAADFLKDIREGPEGAADD